MASWEHEDCTPFEDVPDPLSVTLAELKNMPEYRHRATNHAWAEWCSICYNGILRMDICPTRIGYRDALRRMGLYEQVKSFLQAMGVGTICTKDNQIYPELVRQCLASAVVIYDNPSLPRASEGRLVFFCRGRRYEISIPDICRAYGFEPSDETCSFDESICNQLAPVWYGIASGVFNSPEMKISRIRNPVLRVVAKMLSLTFFAKAEAAAVRYDELYLLCLGLSSDIVQSFLGPEVQLERVNLGAIFAERIASRKARVLQKKRRTKQGRTETIGNLLTPIFEACGIDLSREPCGAGSLIMDLDYLARCHMYYSQSTGDGIYEFCLSGTTTYCHLPKQMWTALDTLAHVQFRLPLGETCTARGCDVIVPGLPAPEGGAGGGAADHRDSEDDHYHLPEYDERFRPLTPPSDASSSEKQAYQGMRANHERKKGFWNALRFLTRSCCQVSDATAPTPAPAPAPTPAHESPTPVSNSDASPARERSPVVRSVVRPAPPPRSRNYCSGDESDDEIVEPLHRRQGRIRRRSERSSDDD